MATFVVAHFKISDPQGYAAYSERAIPLIAAHGGTALVADDTVIDLWHHRPKTRVIVVSFPSRQAARAWIESPEYRAVSEERVRSTETYILLLADGLA